MKDETALVGGSASPQSLDEPSSSMTTLIRDVSGTPARLVGRIAYEAHVPVSSATGSTQPSESVGTNSTPLSANNSAQRFWLVSTEGSGKIVPTNSSTVSL